MWEGSLWWRTWFLILPVDLALLRHCRAKRDVDRSYYRCYSARLSCEGQWNPKQLHKTSSSHHTWKDSSPQFSASLYLQTLSVLSGRTAFVAFDNCGFQLLGADYVSGILLKALFHAVFPGWCNQFCNRYWWKELLCCSVINIFMEYFALSMNLMFDHGISSAQKP